MRQWQWIAVARRTSHVNTKLRRPCFARAAQRLSNESVISKQRRKTLTPKETNIKCSWPTSLINYCSWFQSLKLALRVTARVTFKTFLPFPAAQELARKFNQSAVRLFAIQSLSSNGKTKKTWRTISHSKLNMPSQIVLLASFARIISPKIASE